MAEKIIKALIVDVHDLNPVVGSGVYKELMKSVGTKYQTEPEAIVKWSINNLITRLLSELAIKNANKEHDFQAVGDKSLEYLQTVLLPYMAENQPCLAGRVNQFVDCYLKVLEMDKANESVVTMHKVVTDFLDA